MIQKNIWAQKKIMDIAQSGINRGYKENEKGKKCIFLSCIPYQMAAFLVKPIFLFLYIFKYSILKQRKVNISHVLLNLPRAL